MKQATIFGAGMMGTPIAWAMQKMGYDVLLLDPDEDALDQACDKLPTERIAYGAGNLSNQAPDPTWGVGIDWDRNPDVVISAVPYHVTAEVAKACFENGIPYCDLGGNPDVSTNIHAMSKRYKTPCFTDLGCAPGLANIILESMYVEGASKARIMVGGLPLNNLFQGRAGRRANNTLQYSLVS